MLLQLPLRNEALVVTGLLEAVAALDWPRDRLTVQVLDDSDDETVPRCRALTARLRAEGLDIHHIRRRERTGFKAGALAHGLTLDDAPYIAILDADFRPAPDWLRQAMAVLLDDADAGLVQTRWDHRNAGASWTTRAQALHLDAHFSVEQRARARAPLFMGFNGTAGIWRRRCLDAAGGWSADTLTEDLDVSLRAQLNGWRLRYADTIGVPAELPAGLGAICTQQHRWMKGGAQVCRKLLPALWRQPMPWRTRLQTSAHLLGGTVFFAVCALCVTSPALALWPAAMGLPAVAAATALLQLSLVTLVLTYGTACVRRGGRSGLVRLAVTLVPFLALSTGMALHNARAVAEGLAGRPSDFIRTPKGGTAEQAEGVRWVELLLCGWGVVGHLAAMQSGNLVFAGFLATQAAGFGAVALGGLRLVPRTTTQAVR